MYKLLFYFWFLPNGIFNVCRDLFLTKMSLQIKYSDNISLLKCFIKRTNVQIPYSLFVISPSPFLCGNCDTLSIPRQLCRTGLSIYVYSIWSKNFLMSYTKGLFMRSIHVLWKGKAPYNQMWNKNYQKTKDFLFLCMKSGSGSMTSWNKMQSQMNNWWKEKKLIRGGCDSFTPGWRFQIARLKHANPWDFHFKSWPCLTYRCVLEGCDLILQVRTKTEDFMISEAVIWGGWSISGVSSLQIEDISSPDD